MRVGTRRKVSLGIVGAWLATACAAAAPTPTVAGTLLEDDARARRPRFSADACASVLWIDGPALARLRHRLPLDDLLEDAAPEGSPARSLVPDVTTLRALQEVVLCADRFAGAPWAAAVTYGDGFGDSDRRVVRHERDVPDAVPDLPMDRGFAVWRVTAIEAFANGARHVPDAVLVQLGTGVGESAVDARVTASYRDAAAAERAEAALRTFLARAGSHMGLRLVGLAEPLAEARVAREATEVRVRVSLGVPELRLLVGAVARAHMEGAVTLPAQ